MRSGSCTSSTSSRKFVWQPSELSRLANGAGIGLQPHFETAIVNLLELLNFAFEQQLAAPITTT